MPKWLGKVLGIGAGTILLIGGTGYWYVFIAGAPQLDPPKIIVDADLKFELKTYKSAAMNSQRTYGLILPPGYAKNPKQRYPVILLLHGGHGEEDTEDTEVFSNGKYLWARWAPPPTSVPPV